MESISEMEPIMVCVPLQKLFYKIGTLYFVNSDLYGIPIDCTYSSSRACTR